MPFVIGAKIVYLETLNTTELLRALSERRITLFFCCVPQFFYLIHERVMQQVKAKSAPARLAFRTMMAISAVGNKLGMNLGKLLSASAQTARTATPLLHHRRAPPLIPKSGATWKSWDSKCCKLMASQKLACATVTPPKARVMGSVGKPLKGVQVKIIDPQPAEGLPYP